MSGSKAMASASRDARAAQDDVQTPGAGLSARGVPERIKGRHAFAHERVLIYIALEMRKSGGVSFSKREIAQMLHLNVRSIDRAVMRLRNGGDVESVPRYDKAGGQLGNAYRATEQGLARADELLAAASEKGLSA